MPPPPVGQREEEFRNWVSIDNDVLTVKERTEEEFTEELVSMIQNNDRLVVEVSDDDDNDEPEEEAPLAAEMRECLRQLVLGLDRTGFQKMDMFSAVKREVEDHLRTTFPPRQTSLSSFFCSNK